MTSNGLVPLLRYRDVAAAVEWLADTFGFDKRNIVNDPDGTVAYAELSYGNGIVMLGPVGQSVLDNLLKQPDELDGIGTQSVYVAVEDVEAHFEHARSAGASIVLEFGSEEAGDRAYAARDPEGHIWNFGAYSPWPSARTQPLPPAAEPAYAGSPTRGQAFLGGAVALLAVASVAGLAALEAPKPMPRFAASPVSVPQQAAVPVAATDEAAALRETLAREAHARQEAVRATAAIREALAVEKTKRLAAETARRELEQKLAATPPPAAVVSPAATPPTAAAATAPPVAETPAATSNAEPKPGTNNTAAATDTSPATTGSLGGQPTEAAITPTAESPPEPVSAGPAVQQQQPAPVTAAPESPKPKPRPQAQRKAPKPAPKKSTGNDPFFMYD